MSAGNQPETKFMDQKRFPKFPQFYVLSILEGKTEIVSGYIFCLGVKKREETFKDKKKTLTNERKSVGGGRDDN